MGSRCGQCVSRRGVIRLTVTVLGVSMREQAILTTLDLFRKDEQLFHMLLVGSAVRFALLELPRTVARAVYMKVDVAVSKQNNRNVSVWPGNERS